MKPAALGPDKNRPNVRSLINFCPKLKHRMIYTLLLPGLIWLLLFAYLPMGGLSLAFKDYKANMGIWGAVGRFREF